MGNGKAPVVGLGGLIKELILFLSDHYREIGGAASAGTTQCQCECCCSLNSISGLLENRTDNSIGKQQRIWRKSNQKTTCRNQKSYHRLWQLTEIVDTRDSEK